MYIYQNEEYEQMAFALLALQVKKKVGVTDSPMA
jgi:hypothetical protein